ncbi:hypothetical protein BLNAU_17864 [Blattamonas nauphoetae]|uniref:Uncharacterized protein n=1 Tax=Blattamonas nauphoetae TaxID=2049346 RepID=A0ABQ9XAI4_9EUKA|nr:hypothetical protein BLNAU_17864 [Blattamonas nauphoetae]
MDRFVSLKKRLEAMKFYEPLGVESVPLVERLLGELILATETVTTLERDLNKSKAEAKSLTTECEYLAHEKSRATDELNALHQKMINQTVQAHARERQCELALEKMADQIKDVRFLNTQLCERIYLREKEIEQLQRQNDRLVGRSLNQMPVRSVAKSTASSKRPASGLSQHRNGSIRTSTTPRRDSYKIDKLDTDRKNDEYCSCDHHSRHSIHTPHRDTRGEKTGEE